MPLSVCSIFVTSEMSHSAYSVVVSSHSHVHMIASHLAQSKSHLSYNMHVIG